MKTRKSTSKKVLSSEIFLPLDVYEHLMQEVEAYKKIQKEQNVKWVTVRLSASPVLAEATPGYKEQVGSTAKKPAATKKTSKTVKKA